MGPVSFSSHEHDAISELMTLCIEVRASREVRKTQRKVRRGRLGRFGRLKYVQLSSLGIPKMLRILVVFSKRR
jgi:hypothetical protein